MTILKRLNTVFDGRSLVFEGPFPRRQKKDELDHCKSLVQLSMLLALFSTLLQFPASVFWAVTEDDNFSFEYFIESERETKRWQLARLIWRRDGCGQARCVEHVAAGRSE